MKTTAILLAVLAGLSQSVGAATISSSDSFNGSEQTMTPRFFRSGTPGEPCAEFSSGNFQYKTHSFPSDASGQVTANFDPGNCGTGIYVTFHSTAFNPANICEGFQFANGSSAAFTETFSVPANSPIVMAVSGVANAPGVSCGPYTFQIDGVAMPSQAIPAIGPLGLGALAGLLGLAGFARIRRRG